MGSNPSFCLICFFNSHSSSFIPTSTGRRHYHATHRSQPKYILFRPGWRRRPHFISTLILIFRAPRSVYSNPPRVWNNLPYYHLRIGEKTNFRTIRYNLRHVSYWPFRFHRLSSPHIYSRNRRRHTSLFYYRNYNYCSTHRS